MDLKKLIGKESEKLIKKATSKETVDQVKKAVSPESLKGMTKSVASNSVTLMALRCSYPAYEEHFKVNSKLEGNSLGFIIDQENCPNFAIGGKHMDGVGCEIAATYNAIKLAGGNVKIAEIIREFEKEGYLMRAITVGDLGSDPYAIGSYMKAHKLHFTKLSSYDEMAKTVDSGIGRSTGIYIVSKWNTGNITDGLHTICFYTSNKDNNVNVYNLHPGQTSVLKRKDFESLVEEARFIVGYKLG